MVQGYFLLSVNINFVHPDTSGLQDAVLLGELLDGSISAGLLMAELIARESQNGQSSTVVLVELTLQLGELSVIRFGFPSEGSHVDNQDNTASQLFEGIGLLIDIGGNKGVKSFTGFFFRCYSGDG
eukprot:NODE_1221_length_947_cov_211.819512_g1175_i0.p1 GENE.NODE_1221_length_947_cov_211.819512_g1175_i0~~NODE_1221_length_947_cov_211.819512_g1175_i0.p1  ORF type:complete len:126 (+),score=16.50 NODE_1221_length_947_cov_211.819512_g1175_i0:483-860(+)